jgi:hypothetical protein
MQQLYQAALSNLVKAQTSDDLSRILLKLGNVCKVVNLKRPVMFVIGDMQGGNTIAGRPPYYGKNAKRVSRSCDASFNQLLETPTAGSCNRLIMNDVMELVKTQNWDALHDLFQASTLEFLV